VIITFGKTYDGVSDLIKTVTVGGAADTLAGSEAARLRRQPALRALAPGGTTAWGMLVNENRHARWFGKPGDPVKAALTAAAKQK